MTRFKLWIGFIRLLCRYLFEHLPLPFIAIVAVYFSYTVLSNPKINTLTLTNYGFAITAGLASISFSYAPLLDDTELKKKIRHAGEMFVRSAIYFLSASVLKYFILEDVVKLDLIRMPLNFVCSGFFLISVVDISMGIISLNNAVSDQLMPIPPELIDAVNSRAKEKVDDVDGGPC
jgi:hypothetical protein